MNGKALRKATLCIALGACMASMASVAMAQDGSVVGRLVAEGGESVDGVTVAVRNPDTGFTRSVRSDASGGYRIPLLPVGNYILEISKDGAAPTKVADVTVNLGNATTVNVPVSGINTLGAITVTAPRVINRVDVTSTETATNVTREEIARLPVDQNIASVAMLAPGVVKGDSAFGGISFGGSSVAENSFYINGLNVTDFYNRNGFSSAPFAFYQEFQVKTGGYSVEFGRSTGGVINAVTRSGSNDFDFGVEYTAEPSAWQAATKDRYNDDGSRYLTSGDDRYSSLKMNMFASGPLIKDRLFFFAMYEARDFSPQNTSNQGDTITRSESDDGFWGTKLDWHINDSNLLELMAFSDKNSNIGEVHNYDYDLHQNTSKNNTIYNDTGGRNWNLTYTGHFTDAFSMKLMYGENEREAFLRSLKDIECNIVTIARDTVPDPIGEASRGCTTSSTVRARLDDRQAARADFEWSLGDHLLRFGLDREVNTSNYDQYYAGPDGYYYGIYGNANPGDTVNGAPVPAGYTEYVRRRRYEVAGEFETVNSAYYIEDNWSITPNFLVNIGLRNEAFDNKDSGGNSYIKMDDMWAPRFGFSWDMKGDGTTKLYGNLGRYFLPVANVINIKQAGGFLDERTYFGFDGWEYRVDSNGVTYAFPILGPQIGGVDTSQGDGSVGDLRSEVDRDMDPVYQDELILGFQQMINDKWSWGVSGTYRRLNNAIDDMEISATGACGGDGYVGWVMANPGEDVTVWGDTDCDGEADGWVTVDTSKEGWAMYDSEDNYLGQSGWIKPKRIYKAVEFQIDRAWDGKWALNASYTWSKSEGNAEGPVNSDTNFDDTGRTENFDNPWVNYRGYGALANDRRHQIKVRGTYAINDHWQLGATLDAKSGGPITGFGTGNPFDATGFYSYYICVDKCGFIPGEFDEDGDPVSYPSTDRVYQYSPRGGYGRMPWTFNMGASLAYQMPIGENAKLKVKFAIYNLLNHQRKVAVDQELQPEISNETNPYFKRPENFEAPRFGQLTLTLDF